MKNFKFILILCLLSVYGCAKPTSYEDYLPYYSPPVYPTPPPVSIITDGIKVKLANASGKTKISGYETIAKGNKSKKGILDSTHKWNIRVENNLVYSKNTYDNNVIFSNKRETFSMEFDCIHEFNGKEIKLEYTGDSSNRTIVSKMMPDYIKNKISMIGKKIKTNDVFNNSLDIYSQTLKKILPPDIPLKSAEIVKGLGSYKNKKVLVTEITKYLRITDPSISKNVFALRGRGYKLYDPETFIELYGKEVISIYSFSQERDDLHVVLETIRETTDIEVTNIIDEPPI